MTAPQRIVKTADNWPKVLKNTEEDIIAMQTRNFQATSSYLTISRMLFDNPDFSYTNIDEIFTLSYNIDSLDVILSKVLHNKNAFGKQPKAIFICIPSLAQHINGAEVQGFIMFSNFELTSKRMFYAFDGFKIAPMSNIMSTLQMPNLLREFQYLLPYYITRN